MKENLLERTYDFLKTLADLHPEIAVFQQCADKAKDELMERVEELTDLIKDITDDIDID